MEQPQEYIPTPEEIELLKEEQEDATSEGTEDSFLDQQEYMEAYGHPQPEEKINQHAFLNKAAFDTHNTIKTTYLTIEELGRPLFNVRFLMDMEDIAKHYLDPFISLFEEEKEKKVVENKIANYFLMKAYNISESGMSHEGFTMNLNVMRQVQMTRRRERNPLENLKGGKKK